MFCWAGLNNRAVILFENAVVQYICQFVFMTNMNVPGYVLSPLWTILHYCCMQVRQYCRLRSYGTQVYEARGLGLLLVVAYSMQYNRMHAYGLVDQVWHCFTAYVC